MLIFISYSRQNEPVVKHLVRGLETTGKSVWYDLDLTGGDLWWEKILDKIRSCTVFIFVVSEEALQSKACMAELRYAAALGKPIVPVQVGKVEIDLADPLSRLQIVAYRPEDAVTGFGVVAAVVAAEQRARPLPSTLPPEPQIPYVYLRALAAQIDTEELRQADQIVVVEQLRRALRDEDAPRIRQQILKMLRSLLDKPWVTKLADSEIRKVLLVEDPNYNVNSADAIARERAKPQPARQSPPPADSRPIQAVRPTFARFPDPAPAARRPLPFWTPTAAVPSSTHTRGPATSPHPPTPHPIAEQSKPARPPAAQPRKRRTGRWVVPLVIMGVIGGAGWYATHTAPASAAVGDCLAQTGGNELTKVGCGDPSARFEVLGKLENKTKVDASLHACAQFPKATSSYWEGKSRELGLVLCLAPVERAAAK